MTTFKLSKLLGININKPEKARAIILGQRAINSLLKCFKKERFGILTFQSVTPPSKRKNSSHILLRFEEELKRLSLNYLQISAHWHIRMKNVFSAKEIGYFKIFYIKSIKKTNARIDKISRSKPICFWRKWKH